MRIIGGSAMATLLVAKICTIYNENTLQHKHLRYSFINSILTYDNLILGSSDKLFIHANCILAANDIKRDDLIAFHIREGQKYVEKEIGSSGSLFFYACVMCDQVLNENQAKAFVNLCIKSKQIVYAFKIYEVMTTRYLDVENICLEAEKLARSNNRMDVKKYFEAVRCRFYFLNKNFQQLGALLSQWETDALVNSETDAFDKEALKAEMEFIKILTYLQQGKWAQAQEILQSLKLPESNDKKYLLPSWRTNDELYVMFHIIGYLSMRHESSKKAELLLQVAEKEIQNVSNSTWKRITLFMIYCYKIETFVSQERFEEIEKCLIEFSNVSQDIDRLDQLDIWKRFLFVFALLQQARGDYEAANVFYDLCARDCIELDLKVIALSHMLQIHVIGANTTEEIISIRKALVKIVDETQPYLAILLQIIDCISLIYYDDCVEARKGLYDILAQLTDSVHDNVLKGTALILLYHTYKNSSDEFAEKTLKAAQLIISRKKIANSILCELCKIE